MYTILGTYSLPVASNSRKKCCRKKTVSRRLWIRSDAYHITAPVPVVFSRCLEDASPRFTRWVAHMCDIFPDYGRIPLPAHTAGFSRIS